MLVAFVVWMHTQCTVCQHGFRARGGDVQTSDRGAITQFLWPITEWVFNVPHEAVALFVFYFQIAHC